VLTSKSGPSGLGEGRHVGQHASRLAPPTASSPQVARMDVVGDDGCVSGAKVAIIWPPSMFLQRDPAAPIGHIR